MTTGTIINKIDSKEVTCSAPVNIAVIKYWGKRDSKLLLPTNSSLSLTLNQDDLKTVTTIRASSHYTHDNIFLNGKQEDIDHKRLQNVVVACRRARAMLEQEDASLQKISDWKIIISTVNNFPTAAGLASSASGFACLAFSLAKLYDLPISTSDISIMARLGSGSACRSLFGGFVKWEMGENLDGSDSKAVQVATETDWPDIQVLILVVSDIKKDVGSSVGMQESVQTSDLFTHRINNVVPERMREMESAISNKNFDSFAELTMKDSNQFHAICLDTYPPIFYMNDVSRAIIRVITAYNSKFLTKLVDSGKATGYRVAYTFDAGPNAVLYAKTEHMSELMGLINFLFPIAQVNHAEYFGSAKESVMQLDPTHSAELAHELRLEPCKVNSISRIIRSSVGDGPRILSTTCNSEYSLLDKDGIPKNRQ